VATVALDTPVLEFRLGKPKGGFWFTCIGLELGAGGGLLVAE